MRHPDDRHLRRESSWLFLPVAMVVCSPILVAFFLAGTSFDPPGRLGWPGKLGGLVGAGVWFLSGLLLTRSWYRKARKTKYDAIQNERDRKAAAIVTALQQGADVEPYAVYLRSFQTDDLAFDWFTFSRQVGDHKPLAADSLWASTFEDELAFAMRIPLVSIGEEKSTSRLGVARIASNDANWRQLVDSLLHKCVGVVICPWHTPGVLDELVRIIATPELLRKTAFFMPPARSGRDIAIGWEMAERACLERNVKLPEYLPGGLLFNGYGAVVEIEGALGSRGELGECIKWLWQGEADSNAEEGDA